MKKYQAVPDRSLLDLSDRVRRRKPRDFVEWKTLKRWDALPKWEEASPGFLLRQAREEAGVTQAEMGKRLGCSQQAVAQAERWNSNPTVQFLREWAQALGQGLEISIEERT